MHVAISVLGKDNPGIVATVTKVLFETGCNIEDSSMTSLRNEFAMILLAFLPSKLSISVLKKKLVTAGKKLGLTIVVRPLNAAEDETRKLKGHPYCISVYGADKPGIVYKITSLLAKKKINITDVQTNILASDTTVYIMLLEIDLPALSQLPALRADLEKTARKLRVASKIYPVDETKL